jgi:hypothetical protein
METQPPGKPSEKTLKKYLRSPAGSYAPTSGWWSGIAAAALDGRPVFTWLDVGRMLTDPHVIFISHLWRAPFQKVKLKVRARKAEVANFVQNTLRRFWKSNLPHILARYFEWGYGVGGAVYDARDGWLRLDEMVCIEPRDARPVVYADGAIKGKFAGYDLSTPNSDRPAAAVRAPHAFWFSGYKRMGALYDRPPISGMFEPWLEKNGRGGAKHLRRLWFRKHAADGGVMRYPDGTTVMGTDENPTTRNNQDIAREILDYKETMSTLCLVNDRQPGPDGTAGDYEWVYEPSAGHADVAGFLDYPDKLDDDMLKGACIPKEVVASAESGSGYNGRLLPYQGFLSIVDELSGVVVGQCEPWLRPLVAENFGADQWYEAETVSLADQVEQEQNQKQKRSGEMPAQPGMGGDLPFTLSALDERLGRSGYHITEDGDYVLATGRRPWSQGVALSTYAAPVVAQVPPPPPGPDAQKLLLDAVAAIGERFVAAIAALAPRPAPLELAATVTPEDDPGAKTAAFERTAGKLMRNRKSAIAQLLALAMVRTQQRATAAGKPEAAAGSLAALSEMAGDPVQVAKIVGMKELSALELAWTAFTTTKGTTAAVSDTATDAAGKPKKLYGKAAQAALEAGKRRLTKEEGAKKAREVLGKFVGKKGTFEDLPDLAANLGHLSLAELNQSKAALEAAMGIGFNMKGEKKKEWRVQRILDRVEQRTRAESDQPPAAKLRAPEKSRNPSKSKYAGTVTQSVIDFGGIDPDSHAFQTVYRDVKHAVEDGIPLAAFRGPKGERGHSGLDQLAQELQAAGHVTLPDDKNPVEHVLDLIKKGAKAHGEEGTSDKELEAAERRLYGGDEGATADERDYAADWEDETPVAPAGAAKGGPAPKGRAQISDDIRGAIKDMLHRGWAPSRGGPAGNAQIADEVRRRLGANDPSYRAALEKELDNLIAEGTIGVMYTGAETEKKARDEGADVSDPVWYVRSLQADIAKGWKNNDVVEHSGQKLTLDSAASKGKQNGLAAGNVIGRDKDGELFEIPLSELPEYKKPEKAAIAPEPAGDAAAGKAAESDAPAPVTEAVAEEVQKPAEKPRKGAASEARAAEAKVRAGQKDYTGLTAEETEGTKHYDAARNEFVDAALDLAETADDPTLRGAIEVLVANLPDDHVVGAGGWRSVSGGRSLKGYAEATFREHAARGLQSHIDRLAESGNTRAAEGLRGLLAKTGRGPGGAAPAAPPGPKGKKGKSNKLVEVAPEESHRRRVALAYNSLLEAAQGGTGQGELDRLHARARAAADVLPEAARAQYLELVDSALKGRGKALPIPDAGAVEDVDPADAAPTPADDAAGEALRAALTAKGEPDPAAEPEVESGAAWKARQAKKKYDEAVGKKKKPAEVARLKAEWEKRQAESDAEQTGANPTAPAKAGVLDDADREYLAGKRPAAPLPAETPGDRAAREARERLLKARPPEPEESDEPEGEAKVEPAPEKPAQPPTDKAPWQMSPTELKASGVKFFRTGKGSLYAVNPRTGQTIRVKSDHTGAGHDAADTGLKPGSVKTVYVDPKLASGLSSAGITGPNGRVRSRVIIKDGKASLLTWNDKAGRWGRAPSGTDVPVSDTFATGMSPLELWQPRDDIPGHEAYGGMHAGNAITEEVSPEEAHAHFVAAAKKAGKDVYKANK